MLLVLALKAGQRGKPKSAEQLRIERPHVRCFEVILCNFLLSSDDKILVLSFLRIEEDVDNGQPWFGANWVAGVFQGIRWNAGSLQNHAHPFFLLRTSCCG